MNEKLLANIRFYFAQSVFMNSIHYKAYDRIKKQKRKLSNFLLGCASVTLVLLVIQLISIENDCQVGLRIVSYVGLLTTAITTIIELFNKEDLSVLMCQHKSVAEKYKTIRDEYMGLIEEIMSNYDSEESIRNKKNDLQKRYSLVGENSPETNLDDYKKAQKGLGLNGNDGEEFTWSDAEIDKFLPKKMRLK